MKRSRNALFAMLLFGVVFLANHTHAGDWINPGEETLTISGGLFLPSFGTSAQVDTSLGIGTEIDLEDDLGLSTEYWLFNHVGLGLAVNWFKPDVDLDESDWNGSVDYEYWGPQIYAKVRF